MSEVRDRLIASAARLFATQGYDGTSVRAICADARTNINAITYHFGGKQALFAAIVQGVSERQLRSAQRLLEGEADSHDELKTRLRLFAEETIASWLEEPYVLKILTQEMHQDFTNCGEDAVKGLSDQMTMLIQFLGAARTVGLLRKDVDVDIAAGGLVERLNSQVRHADVIEKRFGVSVRDSAYRRHWIAQVIDLLLVGAATPAP